MTLIIGQKVFVEPKSLRPSHTWLSKNVAPWIYCRAISISFKTVGFAAFTNFRKISLALSLSLKAVAIQEFQAVLRWSSLDFEKERSDHMQ